MKIPMSAFGDSFHIFPYPPNGAGNGGGIDLVDRLEMIDSIMESKDFPALYRLLKEINSKTGYLMTLGCDAAVENGEFVGYIELCFRDKDRIQKKGEYEALMTSFVDRLSNTVTNTPLDTLEDFLVLEFSDIIYPQKSLSGYKLAIIYRVPTKREANLLLTSLCDFLISDAHA